MSVTEEPKISDIHTLIRERVCDFYGFIQEHRDKIDDHVATCNECHEKMIGWTRYIPKLRERMTPCIPDGLRRDEQIKQLKKGQCLPCGCEVIDTAWTKEEARNKFLKALAEVMQVCEEEVSKIPSPTRILDLRLDTKSLRRLRDKFWLPDNSCASAELRDKEESSEVVQLPETIGGFIIRLLAIHSGTTIMQCSDCWCP